MKEYRVTFSGRGKSFHKDIKAADMDAAMDAGMAYAERSILGVSRILAKLSQTANALMAEYVKHTLRHATDVMLT